MSLEGAKDPRTWLGLFILVSLATGGSLLAHETIDTLLNLDYRTAVVKAGLVEEPLKYVASYLAGWGFNGLFIVVMFTLLEAILYAQGVFTVYLDVIAVRVFALPLHAMWYLTWLTWRRKYIGLVETIILHSIWNYLAVSYMHEYLIAVYVISLLHSLLYLKQTHVEDILSRIRRPKPLIGKQIIDDK